MREDSFDFSNEFRELRGSVSSEKMLAPAISVERLLQLCAGDEHLTELLHGTLEQCARYTEDVARFLQIEAEGEESKKSGEYYEIEAKRTRTHDATIDSINILARELSRRGRDGSFVERFAGNRTAYMKFAITLTFDSLQPQT